MSEEKDSGVLIAVRFIVLLLPMIFKLGIIYLRYKRAMKKREKVFRKTLKKEGVPKQVREDLVDELEDLSLSEMLSKAGVVDKEAMGFSVGGTKGTRKIKI